MKLKVNMFTDGKAQPNPGQGTWGSVIDVITPHKQSRFLALGLINKQQCSNNEAEYFAWLHGLRCIKYLQIHEHLPSLESLTCIVDSELLANQNTVKAASQRKRLAAGHIEFVYRTNPPLADIRELCYDVISQIRADDISVQHVHREKNAEADLLTNIAYGWKDTPDATECLLIRWPVGHEITAEKLAAYEPELKVFGAKPRANAV